MEKAPSKLVPALIGGCVMGVLSAVPIINMGNCLCCMWILLGGAVGAYFYSKQLPSGTELTSGDGAMVGLLSGLFGALFGTFLAYFFMAIGDINPARDFLEGLLESRSDLSPEVEDFLDTTPTLPCEETNGPRNAHPVARPRDVDYVIPEFDVHGAGELPGREFLGPLLNRYPLGVYKNRFLGIELKAPPPVAGGALRWRLEKLAVLN